MKECPHCHEDSFGFRDLFALDYFHSQECRACGKPARNDGFRQFLTIPAIITALFLGFVILTLLPDSLEPFGLLLIIALVVLPIIVLAKPVKVDSKADVAPFSPNLNNDKVIMVRGWNEDELRNILDDFIEADRSDSPPYKIDIHKRSECLFTLTFPQDIHPTVFGFLVNYLAYPSNFDLSEREVVVAGETTLNSDFEGIPQRLLGKKAIIYVPENDRDYDGVYLQTETDDNLAISFSEDVWRSVKNARLSSEVKTLLA